MARIAVSADRLTVELTTREKLAAVRGDVTVDRSKVTGVRVTDDTLGEVKGLRLPGGAWPGRWAIGRWQRRHGADFVVARRGERGVVIDLADGASFRRLIVDVDDPERVAAELS